MVQVVPLFCVRQIPPPLATVPANTAKVTLLNVKNLSAYTWLVAVRVPLAISQSAPPFAER